MLTHAQEEAKRLNHDFIGAEHILLGLARETDGVFAKVMSSLGSPLDEIESSVLTALRPLDQSSGREIELMPRAKRIIELAVDEARQLNSPSVGTEHLLIGLVSEGKGVAADLLESLGVKLEEVRTEANRIATQAVRDSGIPGRNTPAFKQIVRMALDEYLEELRKALDGLTAEERRFQPTPEAHHIDFAVWHMARVEDHWVQEFARQTDTVWSRDGWHEKLGLPETGSGYGYTAEQVAGLPAFNFNDLMAYYDAVRAATLKYLADVPEHHLEATPQPARRPGYTVAKMFSHLIVEESQHVGQVAYLRGLQRGINK